MEASSLPLPEAADLLLLTSREGSNDIRRASMSSMVTTTLVSLCSFVISRCCPFPPFPPFLLLASRTAPHRPDLSPSPRTTPPSLSA